MVQLVTRQGKGSALTIAELDQNLINLNDGINNTEANAVTTNSKLNSIVIDGILSNTSKLIHSSNNTIVRVFVYDTSKDTDGGAWTEKCQHTSWYNETICNNWLGCHPNELSARYFNATVGPSVVINGTFTADSNWTKGTGWTIANGIATKISGTASILSQSVLLAPNIVYRVTFTVTRTAGTVTPRFTGGSTVTGSGISSSTTSVQYLTAASGNINLEFSADASFAGTIDNITVVPVITWNTSVDDYFQLTSDGKFYKLNKNFLTSTATLSTQTQWLSAGTYTLSSTTASTGSVVISGAAAGTHTAGGSATTFTVNKSGNVTFTVTGSVTTAQCELGSSITTYQANTTVRYTETFRGNKRSFPKIVGMICDSSGITLHDLTEVNGPMWIKIAYSQFPRLSGGQNGPYPSSTMANGCVGFMRTGNNSGEVIFINFLKDTIHWYGNPSFAGSVSSRLTSQLKLSQVSSNYNGGINPENILINPSKIFTKFVDQVINPSIILQYEGPITLLTNEFQNQILYYNNSWNSWFVAANNRTLYWQTRNGGGAGFKFLPKYENAKSAGVNITSSIPDFARGNINNAVGINNGLVVLSGNRLGHLRLNENATSKSLSAVITNTYNTGYMVGDIRRTYLSDITTGNVNASLELVTNGTFDSDITGWGSTIGSNTPTLSWNNGKLLIEASGGYSGAYYAFNIEANKVYTVKGNIQAVLNSPSIYISISWSPRVDSSFSYFVITNALQLGYDINYNFSLNLSGTVYLVIGRSGSTNSITADNVSIKEIKTPDRSYKNKAIELIGFLTCTPVATGAQLVGYSGWSNTNYLREPYSADLNFGTGEWSASAWANITTTGLDNLGNNKNWRGITSMNGVLYATVENGSIFKSTDLGITWTATNSGSRAWWGITSLDGNLYATTSNESIWKSFDGGDTWVDLNTSGLWRHITSQNGVLYAARYNQTIRKSSDSGNTWVDASSDMDTWQGIVSLNGVLYATRWQNKQIMKSTDNGATWTSTSSPSKSWGAITVLNGNLYASSYGESIWKSSDGGVTWYDLAVGNRSTFGLAALNGLLYMTSDTGPIYRINQDNNTIFSRGYSSGPYISLIMSVNGNLQATAYDGVTTRTVITNAAYNTGTWLKAEAIYQAGKLSIRVNGQDVASTTGVPLLTLNNSNAVLTIGNNYNLDAPFPGSIALLKLSATVPTPDQSLFMYEQERLMFQPNSQVCLPDSTDLLDITYDDLTNRIYTTSASNESQWSGLTRIANTPGSFNRVSSNSGIRLNSTGGNVTITNAAFEIREELQKANELISTVNDNIIVLDYIGGFTANITNGSAILVSVTNQTIPANTTVVNNLIEGVGIPANTVLVATDHLSAAATATTTGLQINFRDFTLPIGYEAKTVSINGVYKQEGSTKDWTRLFDGFRETIRFAVAPGNTAWVQIKAMRS